MHTKLLQSCLTLYNPTNCSLPGSSIHGILQARILEWAAISFSMDTVPFCNFFCKPKIQYKRFKKMCWLFLILLTSIYLERERGNTSFKLL